MKNPFLAFCSIEPPQKIQEKSSIVPFEFKSKHYYVQFIEKEPKDRPDFYLIENLVGNLGKTFIPHYHANYVPKFEREPEIKDGWIYPFAEKEFWDFSIKWDGETGSKPEKGHVMDFHTLAYAGRERAQQNGTTDDNYIGSDQLGIIKADVDHMGQLFSSGLKEDFSFTTYATLSRHLDLFFSAYLPTIQKNEFKYIYTVYAGGDDLFLVGEWQQAVNFAKRLNQEFKKFTGENDNITISTAVYVMQPRHPIRLAAENADELLKEAKDNDRNSIALFGIVLKQDEIEELMHMAEFLNEKRKLPDEKSKVNSGFLQRFLRYCRKAQKFEEDNKISELIYGSRFAYDLGRNIYPKDKDGQIIRESDEWKIFNGLTNVCNSKEMARMQFPISWAILKNRRIQTK